MTNPTTAIISDLEELGDLIGGRPTGSSTCNLEQLIGAWQKSK